MLGTCKPTMVLVDSLGHNHSTRMLCKVRAARVEQQANSSQEVVSSGSNPEHLARVADVLITPHRAPSACLTSSLLLHLLATRWRQRLALFFIFTRTNLHDFTLKALQAIQKSTSNVDTHSDWLIPLQM